MWPALVRLATTDGTAGTPPLTRMQFCEWYFQLARSALRPDALPCSLDDLEERARTYHAKGQVPLALGYFRYHEPTDETLAQIEQYGESGGELPEPGALADRRTCFAGALLRPEFDLYFPVPSVHRGLVLTYIVPAELWTSNFSDAPARLDIDFGDGRGFSMSRSTRRSPSRTPPAAVTPCKSARHSRPARRSTRPPRSAPSRRRNSSSPRTTK